MGRFHIDEDIRNAATLPSYFYRDEVVFEELRRKIFPASWQWVASTDAVKEPGSAFPFRLLDPFLGEPLLLTKNEKSEIHCMSNVCTHRGNLLVHQPGKCNALRCNYHGRRFSLEGRFEFMPEFEEAENFPTAGDHLPQLPLFTFGKFLFTSLRPSMQPVQLFGEMIRRVGFLPFDQFILDSSRSKDYYVNANWALYVDNYLEGFHIPFVHKGLNAVLDYNQYRTELFPWGTLQVGISKTGDPIFDLPQGHPDYGQEITAYFFWLFPNTLLNFYPWGLSLNLVQPMTIDKTRIRYLTYVWRPEILSKIKGWSLDTVELEDEMVVQNVQTGIRSELYKQGRYSPTRELGVHHFHRILSNILS